MLFVKKYRKISFQDPDYPQLLKEIQNFPEALWVMGELRPDEKSIAIVGTRKPTNYGVEAAKFFSKELSRYGFTIVSGLAFGIDKTAHEACLEVGGRTVAVIASGIDRITPKSHQLLGLKIIEKGGAIVSEFGPGNEAHPGLFPRRNRIISGLCIGVLVVEAPETSGALITAQYALEQNREVFVVPGSIFSPNFYGSHKLIKEGATLVTKPEEIMEAFGYKVIQTKFKSEINYKNLKPEEIAIIKCLKENDGITIEELSERTKLSTQKLSVYLTFLEMARYIRKENEKIFINQ